MNEHWRSKQLEEWEEKRLFEVKFDLFAHWMRSIVALVPSALAWWLVDYFNPPFSSTLRFVIVFLSAIYLLGRIVVWLRLWGAYLERELIDIKALLANERPAYYTSGDIASFEPNALFGRLNEIYERLNEIERHVEPEGDDDIPD